MKIENPEKLSQIWVKWEPIVLYFLFSFAFNIESYSWIEPIVGTISMSYFLILLIISSFPLYISLTLYTMTKSEFKLYYRVMSLVSNILFFSVTLMMKGQFLIHTFWIIIITIFSFFIVTILFEGLIFHSWEFTKRALKEVGSTFLVLLFSLIIGLEIEEESLWNLDVILIIVVFMFGLLILSFIVLRIKPFIEA